MSGGSMVLQCAGCNVTRVFTYQFGSYDWRRRATMWTAANEGWRVQDGKKLCPGCAPATPGPVERLSEFDTALGTPL